MLVTDESDVLLKISSFSFAVFVFLYMLRLFGECELPINSLLAEVSPEDHLLVKVCIQSHCVPLLLHNLSVLLPLQTQTTDVPAVGEDQAGLLT